LARAIEIRHKPAPPKRIDLIDVARGVAIAAMIVYHFSWDLGWFGFIDSSFAQSPPMKAFSHAIASAFLFISGVSTVLTHRGRFSPRAFRSHFATIALAAAAVTIATAYFTPQAPVTFGILHALALGALIAAPLSRTHWAASAVVAAIMIALPALWRSPFFDEPAWQWTGLGTMLPTTFDWRPALPWIGVVLAGVAAARTPAGQAFLIRSAVWRADDAATRGLALAGRKSLWIYLIHQPVLLAGMFLVAQFAGAPAAGEARPFLDSCIAECRKAGAAEETCSTACVCIVEKLQAAGQWEAAAVGRDSARAATEEASRACAGK
jgi:uncharacterized membrane protein